MILKNLNFQKFKILSEKFSLPVDDSYIISYLEFVKYFQDIDNIELSHLIIASHFVYGWMPTTLNLYTKEIDTVLPLLNDAKRGRLLCLEELETLKKCINNSMVGLSKLLHFINPEVYAIWDSRVYRYLTEKKSQYGIGNPKLYLEYLQGMKSIYENKDYTSLHSRIEGFFNYHLTHMRAIEIVMFESDRSRQVE